MSVPKDTPFCVRFHKNGAWPHLSIPEEHQNDALDALRDAGIDASPGPEDAVIVKSLNRGRNQITDRLTYIDLPKNVDECKVFRALWKAVKKQNQEDRD